jgi:hypothetical protein
MIKRIATVLGVIVLAAASVKGLTEALVSQSSETQWVTVIRNNQPVWVTAESVTIVTATESFSSPTPIVPRTLTVVPTETLVPVVPTATHYFTPTQLPTRTPTATATATATATSAVTATAVATSSPMVITCDVYPCDVRPSDVGFDAGIPFQYQTQMILNVRAGAGYAYAKTGDKLDAGKTYDVWIVRIKAAGPNGERWACSEFANTCQHWFAIQGDFVEPFGIIEIYSVDVTQY